MGTLRVQLNTPAGVGSGGGFVSAASSTTGEEGCVIVAAGDGVGIEDCSVGVDVGIGVSDGRTVGKMVSTGGGITVSIVRAAASEPAAASGIVDRVWPADTIASGVLSLIEPELAITAPTAANSTRTSKAEPASKTILFDF